MSNNVLVITVKDKTSIKDVFLTLGRKIQEIVKSFVPNIILELASNLYSEWLAVAVRGPGLGVESFVSLKATF